MVIVLVYWRILKGQEEDFKSYWRSELSVADRSRLSGEFLSEPTGHETYPWVTADIRSGSDDFTAFINVGLWRDAEAFHEQIGQYFDPAKGKLDFEYELRTRALLTPHCWRLGTWPLPTIDSEGVK